MINDDYRPVSILLVDDDDIDAVGVKRALDKMRVANPFHRARDGIEGLEMLRANAIHQPYLLLLDLNMPRMNGIEMLKELRSDPDLRGTVVFVLTTSSADQDKVAAYNEHIAGYIVKNRLDSSFDELLKLLDHNWRLVELPVNNQ